jgi:hypothetical protein
MTMGRQGRNVDSRRAGIGSEAATTGLRRDGSFTDRVMARVADEPTPTPVRVFGRSLRRLAMRDAVAALVTAWRLAFEPTSPVGASARASAAALFLSVVFIVGIGGAFVTTGALAYLGSDGPAPQERAPAAAPTETPAVVIVPTPSPLPTPVATPSIPEREESDRAVRTTRETPEPEKRQQDKKLKRETPEPRERERGEDEEDAEDAEDD